MNVPMRKVRRKTSSRGNPGGLKKLYRLRRPWLGLVCEAQPRCHCSKRGPTLSPVGPWGEKTRSPCRFLHPSRSDTPAGRGCSKFRAWSSLPLKTGPQHAAQVVIFQGECMKQPAAIGLWTRLARCDDFRRVLTAAGPPCEGLIPDLISRVCRSGRRVRLLLPCCRQARTRCRAVHPFGNPRAHPQRRRTHQRPCRLRYTAARSQTPRPARREQRPPVQLSRSASLVESLNILSPVASLHPFRWRGAARSFFGHLPPATGGGQQDGAVGRGNTHVGQPLAFLGARLILRGNRHGEHPCSLVVGREPYASLASSARWVCFRNSGAARIAAAKSRSRAGHNLHTERSRGFVRL
jgi:hypothetical protein